MPCDWEEVARELAWAAFKRKLKERVLKKLAGKAAAGAVAAAIDGPFPVGDVIGIITLIWGIAEAGVGLVEALEAWWFLRDDVLRRSNRLIQELTERFGADFLDDECSCNCLKTYLRNLIRARAAGGSKFKRSVTAETRALIRCIRSCR